MKICTINIFVRGFLYIHIYIFSSLLRNLYRFFYLWFSIFEFSKCTCRTSVSWRQLRTCSGTNEHTKRNVKISLLSFISSAKVQMTQMSLKRFLHEYTATLMRCNSRDDEYDRERLKSPGVNQVWGAEARERERERERMEAQSGVRGKDEKAAA